MPDDRDAIRTLADKAACLDALHRLARGFDTKNGELIASAFTPDGTLEFVGNDLGQSQPPITGVATIAAKGVAGLTGLITTHAVTNARITLRGDEADLEAYVLVNHIHADELDRRVLMTNLYTARLARTADAWAMTHLTIANIWFQGDRDALFVAPS